MSFYRSRVVIMSFLLALGSIASGCGGSSSNGTTNTPPPQNQSAAGLWTGSLTSAALGDSGISGLVGSNGQAFFNSPAAYTFFAPEQTLFAGQLTVSGSSVSGSLTGYAPLGLTFPNGQNVATISVSGSVTSQSSLTLALQGGGFTANVSLSYETNSATPAASLALVTGSWGGTPQSYGPGGGPSGTALSISPTGQISGMDISTECQFSGQLSVIDSSLNAYSVTFTVSSCLAPGFDLAYTGVAYLTTTTNPNDTLTWGVTSASFGYTFLFTIE